MHVCRDKTCLLLWQKYACHDKTFDTTKLCLSQQNLVTTKLLSQQIFRATKMCLSWQKFCCDKYTFVMTQKIFFLSRQTHVCFYKSKLVRPKRLSWQKYVCRNNSFVMTRILCCNNRHILSWQTWICCCYSHGQKQTHLWLLQSWLLQQQPDSKQNSCHLLPHCLWYSESIPLGIASSQLSSLSLLSLWYSDLPVFWRWAGWP